MRSGNLVTVFQQPNSYNYQNYTYTFTESYPLVIAMMGGYRIGQSGNLPIYSGAGTVLDQWKQSVSTSSGYVCGLSYQVIANVSAGDSIVLNTTSYETIKAIIAFN